MRKRSNRYAAEVSTTIGRELALAPDFQLPGEDGVDVALRDLIGRGPILLLFYRGDTCSYCNAQLAGFARRHEELEELGAQILAISVDGRPDGAALKTKLRFPFRVLSDVDHAVIDRYGGTEPATSAGIVKGRPATYVIDTRGRIAWSHVGADFADRPLVDEVIDQVRAAATDA